MDASREPDERFASFHASTPTRPQWPSIVRTMRHLDVSQICTLWSDVPTAIWCAPCGAHAIEVTWQPEPAVCMSGVIAPDEAFQR